MASMWRSKLGGEFPRELVDRLDAEHLCALRKLRAEPHNARCADCGRINNTWASVNLGVFLCDRCADVHRALGTHISKVKSCTGVELWGPDEIARMEELDLVLPNKQIHCRAADKAEPSKEELMDHCLTKYGIKTFACVKLSACRKDCAATSPGMRIANASQNKFNDPFPDVGVPTAHKLSSINALSPPIASDVKLHWEHDCGIKEEFNVDDFFADMEPKAVAADVKCRETVEKLDAIRSMSAVAGNKQPPKSQEDVNDLFEAYASVIPGPMIAPTAGPLERTSTADLFKGWDEW